MVSIFSSAGRGGVPLGFISDCGGLAFTNQGEWVEVVAGELCGGNEAGGSR